MLEEKIKVHLGLDDTDSIKGGCTTYIAALLVERFSRLKVEWIDYPNLIRLNPNIPWKTRGNGALCLRFKVKGSLIDYIVDTALDIIEKEALTEEPGTDPALALYTGDVPKELEAFAVRAETSIVKVDDALKLAEKFKMKLWMLKGKRGVVGAIAAIGETLEEDHTYELIAYRVPEMRGMPRQVDPDSVRIMNKTTKNETYNNIDPETGRILITPRGPDPVLYGIRGETPEAVYRGHKMIRVYEPVERWVIFRTNQGTDSHLRFKYKIYELEPHISAIVEGKVNSEPRFIPGGHLIFSLTDGTGSIDCAVYEPTGDLRFVASKLFLGDKLRVYGGIKSKPITEGLTLNVEKFEILELTRKIKFINPLCPSCGKRMKSMGSDKGFRCKKCGFRDPKIRKITVVEERPLKPGLYMPPPRAHRHLTKPLQRYGREKKKGEPIWFNPWHEP